MQRSTQQLVLSALRCNLWHSVQQTRCVQGYARIAEHEKGQTKFNGYYAGGFYINNVQVAGSVLAQRDMYLLWKPRTMAEVTVDSLTFLELIDPKPQVVVFGCGMTAEPLPVPVLQYLKSKNIQAEVLDSRNAAGYFNVLNEEGRVVVGALLAPDPSSPLSTNLPENSVANAPWLMNFGGIKG